MPTSVYDDEFERRFVAEYLKDLNGRAAVKRAGGAADSAASQASRAYVLLRKPHIKEMLAKAMAARAARVEIRADEVLRSIHAAAFTDPNEIVEIRRGCCRHCYGVKFRYQYADEKELEEGREKFEATARGLVDAFEHGGIGFDPRLDPNDECTQCGGEGGAYVHVKDTRNLSPAARALFAGAKQTKDGIEVKLHDQMKSRELLMRHLGLLNDKLEVTGNLGERIIAARKRARGAS